MSLAEKIILVRLRRSWWRGNVTDLDISKEVTEMKNAEGNSGVFVKKAMRNEYFAACTAAYRALDTYHKKMTIPWNDRAERALPSDQYFQYGAEMRKLMGKAETAVYEFVGNLDELIEREKIRLGDAFVAEDYPAAPKLEALYNVDLKFTPLMNPEDIRVAIPEEEKLKIKADCEAMFDEKLKDAGKELFTRLYKAVGRMVDNLEKNSRIYDTMVGNICELVDMLPSLNVGDDQQLTYMAREIKDRICTFDVEDIKKDEDVRGEAYDNACDVLDKMDSIVKGWG